MYASLRTEILPQLIPQNSTVLVAVSGGPDSVALAHGIWRYSKDNQEQKIILVISHVNHCVRPEAEEESDLVKELAHSWGVKLILHKFKAKDYAVLSGKSFQEASRDWRYAQWHQDMQQYGCNLLATAHHLGDQAETVVFRLIRGTGTAGLAGIYPKKGNIIRPLLSFTKKQIIDYCELEQLPYAIDESNYDTRYDRNRIRLELLPLLEKQFNEKVQEALGRTAEVLRWDEEYLGSQLEKLWPTYCLQENQNEVLLSHHIWEQPEAMLSRFLRKAASNITGERRGIEYRLIKKIIHEGKKTGWCQDLPGLRVESLKKGLFFFRREFGHESITGKSCNALFLPIDIEIPLMPERWHDLPGPWKVGIFKTLPQEENAVYFMPFDGNDSNRIAELQCRTRRGGDKVFIKGLGHKSIKKIFQDKKIPADERQGIPLIALDNNVIWIPSICRSDSLVPTENNNNMFCVFAKK